MEIVVFVLMLIGVIAAYSERQESSVQHHRGSSWGTVGEDVGLFFTKTPSGTKRLYGHARGFGVEIEQVSDNDQETRALSIELSGVDSGFSLGRESAYQRMTKPDIETGDPIFDERTRIEGNPDWALALLGDDARRLAEMVISGWKGQLDQEGKLTATSYDIQDTESTLDTLLDLAQLLDRPAYSELPRLLVERACHDPSSGVRLQAFRRLTASTRFREEAHAVAETLIDSPSAFLRLEACRMLVQSSAEDSDRAAEGLVELATRRQVDSSVRCSALEALTESRHGASAIPVMSQILRHPDAPLVRTAALDGLIRADAKAELLEIEIDGEAEAEALARGLGRFDASVQPTLLRILEDFGDRARLAAVRSLGQVGDLEAIRHLRRVVGKDRLFKSSLAREAENVIEEIKGRSDGSQQGEISITTVAPLEGAISPSEDSEAGGEVSLTS